MRPFESIPGRPPVGAIGANFGSAAYLASSVFHARFSFGPAQRAKARKLSGRMLGARWHEALAPSVMLPAVLANTYSHISASAAAQLIAYVENGLFLRLASHANKLASRLGRELAAILGVRLMAPVEANLAFVAMPEPAIEALASAGVRFARRGGGVIRLVTRFDGTPAEGRCNRSGRASPQ